MDWLRKLLGGAGNVINQGARFISGAANAPQNFTNNAVRQVVNRTRPQNQQIQAPPPPKVPQVDFTAVLRNLQALRNQPQVKNIANAANPINQFQQQANVLKGTAGNLATKAFNNAPSEVPKFITGGGVLRYAIPGLAQQQDKAIKQLQAVNYKNVGVRNGSELVDKAGNIAAQQVSKLPGGGALKFAGENIVMPIVKSGARYSDVAGGTQNYAPGVKGYAQLGTDVFNLGSLAYTPAKAGQLAQGGKAALKVAPEAFARGALAGSGISALNQYSDTGKVDLKAAALSGLLGGAGNVLLPTAMGGLGRTGAKALSSVKKPDLSVPIKVPTYAEKGKLQAQGYKNVTVETPQTLAQLSKGVRQDNGLQTRYEQLRNAGMTNTPEYANIRAELTAKGVAVPDAGRIAETAPKSSPEALLKQAGYTQNKAGDWLDSKGKVADIGDIQTIIEPPKLRAAEQAVNTGKITIDQAENITKAQAPQVGKTGKPIYELAPKPDAQIPLKQSGIAKSLEAGGAPVKVYDELPGYQPVANKTLFNISENRVANNEQKVIDSIKNRQSNQPITAQMQADSVYLLNKLIKEGRDDEALAIARATAKNSTEAGRAVQILSKLQKTTPDGALVQAQKIVDKVNEKAKKTVATLTKENQAEIVRLANEVQKYSQGTREWDIAAAKLAKYVDELVPVSLLKKVSSVQTMAQLLNPKTAIRNIIGNLGMATFEDISTVPASVVDRAVSKLARTTRTTAIANPIVRAKGAVKGAKFGFEDAVAGIKTSGLEGKFEVQPDIFKKGVMKKLQTALSVELGAADKAFYTGQFDTTLDSIMRASKTKVPTKDMLEQANAEALYATFQNNSLIAQGLSGAKKGLNLGKDWGLGDLIIKYPKTPGNILSTGLDYSPIGFAKGLYGLVSNWGKLTPAVQREAVRNIGRGITGTGLITGGYMLAQNGIITGKRDSDKDIAALDRQQGGGPFTFNFTALQRLLNGQDTKAQDGDVIANYDWLQPNAIQLSMGANIALNAGKGVDNFINQAFDSIASSADTIVDQPVVKGIGDFVKTTADPNRGGLLGALQNVATNTPASFVPALLNQAGQLQDNVSRAVDSPNILEETTNRVKARIPFLKSTLQPNIDTLGNVREVYQNGSNNLFNVLVNPAFVRTFEKNPVYDLVRGIYERSGESQQTPRVADRKVKVNGEMKELSSQEYTQYQQYIGEKTNEVFSRMSQDPGFNALSDTDKAKKMSNAMTDINQAALISLFGNQPEKVDKGAKAVLNQGAAKYTNTLSGDTASTPAERYQQAVESYNDKVKNGELSNIGKIKEEKELQSLQVKSNFDQDTVDLYSFNKDDLYDYLTNDPNGGNTFNQLIALDDALVAQGATSKFRDKYGNIKSLYSSTKKGKSAKGKKAKVAKAPSIRLSAPKRVAQAKVAKLRSPRLSYPKLAKSSKTVRIKV